MLGSINVSQNNSNDSSYNCHHKLKRDSHIPSGKESPRVVTRWHLSLSDGYRPGNVVDGKLIDPL